MLDQEYDPQLDSEQLNDYERSTCFRKDDNIFQGGPKEQKRHVIKDLNLLKNNYFMGKGPNKA